MIPLMSSLGNLFASYPRLGVEEGSNLEIPMGTDQKNPPQKPDLSS